MKHFTFKPGDKVLIDGHIAAKVRQLGPPEGKLTVTVQSTINKGKALCWCVHSKRCIPDTVAARTLYLK
jgi:hypothetical protein